MFLIHSGKGLLIPIEKGGRVVNLQSIELSSHKVKCSYLFNPYYIDFLYSSGVKCTYLYLYVPISDLDYCRSI